MLKTINELNLLAKGCNCGHKHHEIQIEKVVIKQEAFVDVVSYLKRKEYKKLRIIADEHTFQAAGQLVCTLLQREGLECSITLIEPDQNGDVVADESSIVQVMIETEKETDAFIAVGSGTIHDITRFCSAKMRIPFISIPTAPSVDGFSSMGAPLIIRGVKKTFQTISPIAIFADLTILKDSPSDMIAAGFGDMLGKFTSLCDWKFGHITADEPYCPFVAQLTKDALDLCVENIEKIAVGNEEGIQILMEALIQSGFAMLIFGQSHPASGGEHHLSHYWEMDLIKNRRRQVLHGAKVGVTTTLIAELYKKELINVLDNVDSLETIDSNEEEIVQMLKRHKEEVIILIESIPDSKTLSDMLERISGVTLPSMLGINHDLVNRSFANAHLLRNRYTILKFLNEIVHTKGILKK